VPRGLRLGLARRLRRLAPRFLPAEREAVGKTLELVTGASGERNAHETLQIKLEWDCAGTLRDVYGAGRRRCQWPGGEHSPRRGLSPAKCERVDTIRKSKTAPPKVPAFAGLGATQNQVRSNAAIRTAGCWIGPLIVLPSARLVSVLLW
jgi:hypothetical protein